MVNLALIRPWGTVDLFVLTGFRERTFPGQRGRLRAPLVVDSDRSAFDANGLRRQLGAAVRWSHALGDWDIGIAHFFGTSREPIFEL